jgi:glycosyltransferase involved in cell wall biosynthesis
MKIALVNTGMPLGGTTTATLFLMAGLKQLGVLAKVFSLSQSNPLEHEFARLQIPVYCCDDRKLIFEDRLADVLSQVRDFEPSCVIAGLAPPAFEVLRYVPEGIFRIGMLQDHHPQVYKLAQTYRRFLDHFAAVSRTIKNEMAGKYPEFPCSYLPYGVAFDPGDRRMPNAQEPLKILYFGRLYQIQKQVRMLPDIWRALKKQGIPSRWTIMGEGPEESFLREEMAEGIQAGEIAFSPPIFDRKEISRVIGGHDIFLLCSLHEGLPLALLEAMGQGLVPVCGDIPSLAHGVISHDNGFLVTQNEPAAYAKAIGGLHHDRALLEQMSARAHETVGQDYTALAMARRYVGLIEKHAPSGGLPLWAASFSPYPPLGMERTWFMTPQLLPLRRLYKRLRS